MHFIEIERVNAGETVAVAVNDGEGRLLIGAGQMLTPKMIRRLIKIGITGLYVIDGIDDDKIIESTISNELKAEAVRDLKHLNIDNALNNAKKIVTSLTESEQCNYINIKTFDNYTYEHSVSVSIYSTLIGIEEGLNEDQLSKLALSGLLHDIGKSCIPNEILQKPGKLTYDEFEEMKKHPEYGYHMLKDNFEIGATTKMGVFEHHENEDGSGYPRGLKGNKIYKFAKMVHIADVYDAIISKRPYKTAQTPQEAIDFLLKHEGTMFDKRYLEMFVDIVPAYPKGIMVQLSNGMSGVVVGNRRGYVLRPIIRTLDEQIIDLAFESGRDNKVIKCYI